MQPAAAVDGPEVISNVVMLARRTAMHWIEVFVFQPHHVGYHAVQNHVVIQKAGGLAGIGLVVTDVEAFAL